METKAYEVLIVGSGAGGATLARELSQRGKDVLVVEKGKREEKIGTFRNALRFYDSTAVKVPRKSREGVILWRTLMAGGSTVASCGNATPCLEKELADAGVDISEELNEAKADMHAIPTPESLFSEASETFLQAADKLGYDMQPMPKFVDPAKCKKCGHCTFGCVHGAKWTALDYLDEAQENGAEIVYDTTVRRVMLRNGKARGITGNNADGFVAYRADTVILAAGGLGTPVILLRSGIDGAGQNLFIDMLVNTYGVTDDMHQLNEPSMALVDHEFYESEGFILSPYVNGPRMLRAIEGGPRGAALPTRRLIGMMTKTRDESVGRIYQDGVVSKPVTDRDWQRLNRGAAISEEILVKAGANRKSIHISSPQGAHPGGTATIGKIVDKDLRTEIPNLYVCDASVLPTAPGMPPIMTITALAKRLAKSLAA